MRSYLTSTTNGNPYSVQSLATAPTTQASLLDSSALTTTGAHISWTRGNGSACAVFTVASNSTGNAYPSGGTAYTANASMGSGTQIGSTGWYCVYNGIGTSVDLTGLALKTQYRVEVCEYAGSGVTSNYNQSGPGLLLTFTNAKSLTTKGNVQTISFAALPTGKFCGDADVVQ